ncbi:MAG TPA: hypothetical protein DEA55_04350, partial [Rhodospirillaceae bacterium]|nr:hypothetical protein [Rhodospirillaceae bacterium]
KNNSFITGFLKSYAKLGLRPSTPWLEAWEGIITQQISKLKTQQLTDIFQGYADLGLCPPPELTEELKDRALQIANSLDSVQVLIHLRACAILHCISADERFREIAQTMHRKIQPENLRSAIEINQYRQGSLWFDWPCLIEPEPQEETISGLEKSLAIAFQCSGISLTRKDYIVPRMGHRVDITIDGKHPILVEVDGPTHFVLDIDDEGNYVMGGYNGSTLFQTALMEKCTDDNISIIRAPFDTVKRLTQDPNPLRRKRLILDLLSSAQHGSTYILEADRLQPFMN